MPDKQIPKQAKQIWGHPKKWRNKHCNQVNQDSKPWHHHNALAVRECCEVVKTWDNTNNAMVEPKVLSTRNKDLQIFPGNWLACQKGANSSSHKTVNKRDFVGLREKIRSRHIGKEKTDRDWKWQQKSQNQMRRRECSNFWRKTFWIIKKMKENKFEKRILWWRKV